MADNQVMQFIQSHRLIGQGLGWIDVHLLASAIETARLWSKDRGLVAAADRLGIAI